MILEEVTQIAQPALPLAEFRAHLRLGTGFGEETLQDPVLEGFLRAAIAAVEARTGKVLMARDFLLQLQSWRGRDEQRFPIAPITVVSQVAVTDAEGTTDVISAEAYQLLKDTHLPALKATGSSLPTLPAGGQVEIAFTAGMATDWAGLPVDLQQAVLLLAAHYYEHRHETALSGRCMPFGVTSLLERYRSMRLGLGSEVR